MKGNRRPPPRRPASYADLLKLKAEAKNQGIMEAFIIFFSALRDKEGFGPTRLRRVLDAKRHPEPGGSGCLFACTVMALPRTQINFNSRRHS